MSKGVTLLALGNGAPDIFGAYAAITQAKQGDAGLAIGAIFGKMNYLKYKLFNISLQVLVYLLPR